MNLASPSRVGQLLKDLDLRPSKALGQNFLIDGNVRQIILGLADLSAGDTVLEIGPGLGVLTEGLLERAGRVIAVEKDRRLCAHLRSQFASETRLELIEGDALESGLGEMIGRGVTKVVSNLPYSAGSRILVEILAAGRLPGRMVLTLQRDVARRLAAGPGGRDYGVLALYAQLDYRVSIERRVSPSCFLPVPEVWSAIVLLVQRERPLIELGDRGFYRALVKWGFMHRRKQLGTLLRRPPEFIAGGTGTEGAETGGGTGTEGLLARLGLDPRARPEILSVEDWGRLANALHKQTRHAPDRT